MSNTKEPPKGIKYYPFTNKWHRIRPHLKNSEFRDILDRDFNMYTMGHWGETFGPGQFPGDFETCDMSVFAGQSRRLPPYFKLVKGHACHWLVNSYLKLAELAEPDRPWRILTSATHSTVWDGKTTLFDMIYCAFGEPPQHSFWDAYGRELKPGRQIKVYLAEHYTTASESRRKLEERIGPLRTVATIGRK